MSQVDDHPRNCEGGWDGLSDCDDVERDGDREGRVFHSMSCHPCGYAVGDHTFASMVDS